MLILPALFKVIFLMVVVLAFLDTASVVQEIVAEANVPLIDMLAHETFALAITFAQ
jgi:hypothetical protein